MSFRSQNWKQREASFDVFVNILVFSHFFVPIEQVLRALQRQNTHIFPFQRLKLFIEARDQHEQDSRFTIIA